MTNTPSSKPTIFIADDDPEDQEMLLQAFQKLTDSHHLTLAASGKELLDLLSDIPDSELPCLIVLDYNMPGLNGKQVLKYLHASLRYRDIPKVIYTTSNSYKEKAEFLSMGAQDFMTKASSTKDILNAAKKMLSFCDDDIRQSA